MGKLDVRVTDQQGKPVAGQLVQLNTFNMMDWGKPGIPINPNPRRTGPDGVVNFYNGPALEAGINCQAVCQNGTNDVLVGFDGKADAVVEVTLIPFA